MQVAVLSFRREFGSAISPLFPRYCDFAHLPKVEEIITTSRRIVKPDTFRCLSEMMPDYLENWREEKLSYLEGIIRDSIDLPEDVQAVDLAIGHFFECGLCQSILDIQRVPQHDCMGLGNKKDRYFGRTDYEAAAIKATRSLLDIPVTSGADILRELLEQCGQDYRRATPQDMDELGLLLCCRVCSPSGFFCRPARREVMNWRVAVSILHPRSCHGNLDWDHTLIGISCTQSECSIRISLCLGRHARG